MSKEEGYGPESSGSDTPASEGTRRHRPVGITPEQRRLLDTPRDSSAHPADHQHAEEDTASALEPDKASTPSASVESHPTRKSRRVDPGDFGGVTAPGQPAVRASRAIEAQQAFLILAIILLLGLSFFGGTKLNYVKYLLASRNAPKLEQNTNRYPGIAAEELVKQALAAERAGQWQDAVERFMAAKNKDLRYRGILFRVGKIVYDHRDFDAADKAFERAIAFGENLEAANFYRGLIAVRRRNLPAAEQFFEAAVTAAPFVSDYHYYWGEALRLDLKPEQSLPHYEQAILLARTDQDAAVGQFKIRMAKIEAAEGSSVAAELATKERAGSLSVDWLMTAAALQLRGGHVDSAGQLILQARSGNAPGLFASCVNDFYFQDAAKKYPELAEPLHLDFDLQVPFPE
jgi:tetratricopeptide (TPR) repeat protein